MIYNILLIVQILVALGIIGLVLIQHGKGADAGAAFGGGSSGTVFGSAGASNFLSRATAILAAVFFANSLALAWIVSHSTGKAGSLVDSVSPTPTTKIEAPVSDVPGGTAIPQTVVPVTSDVPTNDAPQELTPATASGDASVVPVPAKKVIEEPSITKPKPIEVEASPTPVNVPSTSTNTELTPATQIQDDDVKASSNDEAADKIVIPTSVSSKPKPVAAVTATVAPENTTTEVKQKATGDVPQ